MERVKLGGLEEGDHCGGAPVTDHAYVCSEVALPSPVKALAWCLPGQKVTPMRPPKQGKAMVATSRLVRGTRVFGVVRVIGSAGSQWRFAGQPRPSSGGAFDSLVGL
ncbi:hypothetical protein GCM10011515_23320 [Tsuneonella deserti]|uniref:Uncharacterized protein n=1 Tax=Tsuneonella deserti TaxID=2035528 RepID=A0ABQ1SDM5_9SPHN|nr:hypothetical protein GCM10011515_23320 [Tsuneonella deserti]